MFKKILLTTILVLFIGVLVFGAYNRTQAKSGTEGSFEGGTRRGQFEAEALDAARGGGGRGASASGSSGTAQGGSGWQAQSAGVTQLHVIPPTGELTPAEVEAVQYMREEEKLAYDLYTAMYELWGTRTFANISRSEQVHMSAIGDLISAYGVQDPAAGQPGVFTNPDLQALYDQLLAQGSGSAAAALEVGVLVEQTDIADLQQYLKGVNNPSVVQVFTSLLRGSENHLRAFTRASTAQVGSQQSYGGNTGAGGSGQGGGNGYRGGGQGGTP